MSKFERIVDDIYLLKIPFGPVFTGVVLIDGDEKLLVDSGATSADVDAILLPALKRKNIKLEDITLLCTHTHGDHIGGHARLGELGVGKIVCYEASKPKLENPVKYAIQTRTRFPEFSPAPQTFLKSVRPDKTVKDGELIAGRLRLIATPGHDDDCVAFLDEKTGTLITGDSLQANGTVCQGIAFYKSLKDYKATLKKISKLPLNAILCAHDYDGIGAFIGGKDAVRHALEICAKRIGVYSEFIALHKDLPTNKIAEELIKKEGCGTPDHLFMAMYTVNEHLNEEKEKVND